MLDLTDQIFGLWRVLGPSNRKHHWRVQCKCGTEKELAGGELRRTRKPSRSCGCLGSSAQHKHGQSRTKLYAVWRAMCDRCRNSRNKNWDRYGGRGITVCARWLGENGFENFAADVGAGKSEGKSLDRINNDAGYSPENVRWVDMKTQGRNRCNSRMLTHDGKTMSVVEWGEHLGINHGTIATRLSRGMSVERALTKTK